MTFADKLKNLMKDLDLTQSKLSDLPNIAETSIFRGSIIGLRKKSG